MPNSVKIQKLIRALIRLEFHEIRRKGSHAFFEHSDGRITVIPMHKEIRVKLLTKIIKHDLKMTKEKFQEYL